MSKRTYPLTDSGYATAWLISGPLETPVDPSTRTIADQNHYEQYQQRNIHDDCLKNAPENVRFGEDGMDGMPWHFYPAGPNCFVDVSKFYFVIYRCEFWIATSIVSPREQEVDADIWYYPSFDAWLNGEHISACTVCRYVPMRRNRVKMSLKKGENLFFLRAQNACTRDTRNIVALSFPNSPDIKVAYPGEDTSKPEAMRDAVDWLYSVKWDGKRLTAPSEAPEGVTFTVNGQSASGKVFEISEKVGEAKIRAEICGLTLERRLEITERYAPAPKLAWESPEKAREAFIQSLADRTVPPSKNDPQLFYTVYARLAKGCQLTDDDIRIIRTALSDTETQKDCSDFRLCYILAAVKRGFFPEHLVDEVKKAALNYSYWFDEPAIGAMCYGSENHSLLFHSCQMLAGILWQDEVFVRSGRTGREQEALAKQRIDAWITKIEANGFGEFLSGGYSPVTVAALLAVLDFAGEPLSSRASALLDSIFRDIAHNTFDGIVYAPQGRIYRGVIRPWTQGTQTLSYFSTGTSSPCGIGDFGSWFASFADTSYKFPTDLEKCAHEKGMYYGKASGTRIQTFKGDGFMLTSLPLEMVNGECFGKYKPGAIGYQQHLSYATLGGNCMVFAQHPGGPYDGVAIRPGYWFGNGYLPAQTQWNNVLGQVFPISEDHPIKFTHLYFPIRCFEGFEQKDGWLFGKRGNGFVAVWCSNKLSLYDGDICQGTDFRAENGPAAYLTVCGDTETNGSYESFKEYAFSFAPAFDRETLTLKTAKGQSVGGEFVTDPDVKNRFVV